MQVVRSVGLDRLKRFVCLLLIFVLLFCFFMCPRASAVAVEAATVAYAGALVGTILVGAGVIFSSHGDMQKVGAAMYKSWVNSSNAIGSKISAIAAWAVEHGEAAAKGALRVGKELYQAIIDSFNADYDSGSLSFGGDFVGASRLINSQSIASDLGKIMKAKRVKEFTFSGSKDYGSGRVFLKQDTGYVRMYMQNSEGTKAVVSFDLTWYGGVTPSDYYIVGGAISYSYMYFYLYVTGADGRDWSGGSFDINTVFTLSFPGCPVENVLAPDLAYPSDSSLVRMPDIPSVDTDTGEAVFPTDAAYTKDAVSVPYPTDADGVKVPDIPYDQVVDQSTGKALDDTDTGTDTGTDTDNPSKPGEDTDTDNPSDSVNWPSAGDISLPKLIISKFPFCIPFDVADMIALLETDLKAPVFKMPIKVGSIVNEEISLDLEQYSDVIRIVRWGELLLFVAGLAYVTRNYIKW